MAWVTAHPEVIDPDVRRLTPYLPLERLVGLTWLSTTELFKV